MPLVGVAGYESGQSVRVYGPGIHLGRTLKSSAGAAAQPVDDTGHQHSPTPDQPPLVVFLQPQVNLPLIDISVKKRSSRSTPMRPVATQTTGLAHGRAACKT